MSDLKNKITSWYEKFFSKTPSYERRFLRPSHDWMIIFSCTLVALLFCVLGSFYFYKAVDSGKYFSTTEENVENEVKINLNLLKKTVDDINTRELNFTKALVGDTPADPSR